jgi:hypothetical protein
MKDAIGNTFDRTANRNGLRRFAGCWAVESEDVIGMIELQRSPVAHRYFVNIAWWIKPLAAGGQPTFNRSHVRMRVADDRPAGTEAIDAVLDFSFPLADPVRAERLERLMEATVLPFLVSGLTLTGLHDHFRARRLDAALLNESARRLLSEPSST